MDRGAGLIVLDRDGVLNATIPSAVEPRPDSPLRPGDVAVFPWVPALLRRLNDAGHAVCIASNQPAAAKGKTTRAELEQVHRLVVEQAQGAGGVILSSHICFHRAEDGCGCRKPRTGLLEEIFQRHPGYAAARSWMVGDRATDVLAGAAFGMQTALLGAAAPPGGAAVGVVEVDGELAALAARSVQPSFCGIDLRDFGRFLLDGT